ncbi:MAG TPA: DUF4162 domain-containing protein [Verrucomicrobiales bacterium]|nr:DUF4162 domain-containing protein [Verrucomicrobiales bacterium]
MCDRIGIVDHGKFLVEGTLSELQEQLGGNRLFILEGDFKDVHPDSWPGFSDEFRIIQQDDGQLMVSPVREGNPSEDLKRLLSLPVELENVTLKRPNLNDLFLKLTGRGLRE